MQSRPRFVFRIPCRAIIMAVVIGGLPSGFQAFGAESASGSTSRAERQDDQGVRITAPARAAMEELRSAYRSAAGFSIKITGHSEDECGTLRPIRTSLLMAASGDVKVLTPSCNLTHLRGVVYADSSYFPGYIVKSRVPRLPDATVNGLQSIWPLSPLPIEIRIRLGSSVESAFAPLIEAVGKDGVVESSAGVWPDGTPVQGLRFRGGRTDVVVWIDPSTSLVRGVRGRIDDKGRVTVLDEAREVVAVDRSPQIVVTTKSRIPVESFDALRAAWDKIYTSPPPSGAGGG